MSLLHDAIKLASKLMAYSLLSVRPLFGEPFQIIYAAANFREHIQKRIARNSKLRPPMTGLVKTRIPLWQSYVGFGQLRTWPEQGPPRSRSCSIPIRWPHAES